MNNKFTQEEWPAIVEMSHIFRILENTIEDIAAETQAKGFNVEIDDVRSDVFHEILNDFIGFEIEILNDRYLKSVIDTVTFIRQSKYVHTMRNIFLNDYDTSQDTIKT